MSNMFTFSATEVGYNHVKVDKVCEDASGYYDDDKMHICVVADGHGSDNYPRTDRGSDFAVKSTIDCVRSFVETAEVNQVLSDEEHGFPVMLQLAKSILKDWHERVNADYSSDPFKEEELVNVSEKYRKRYMSENEEERTVEKAYGCTLIVYVVTAKYSFGMQVGDGKCVVVDKKGDFSEPIPWDDNCQLNVTTSICDADSIDEFRFYITDSVPTAVFCGSDGIDDSYTSDEEVYALYRSILKIFIEHGIDVGKSEIKEYLPVLTKKGSGDDVSISLFLDLERAESLLPRINMKAEEFDLRNKLKENERERVRIEEQLKALQKRIDTFDLEHDFTQEESRDINEANQLLEEKTNLEIEKDNLEKKIENLQAQELSPELSEDSMSNEINDNTCTEEDMTEQKEQDDAPLVQEEA